MSEQDNLQNADGNKENKVPENTSPKQVEEVNAESISETTKKLQEPENEHSEDDVINEIDNSNAEDAEDEGTSDRHNIEEKNYSEMSLDTLVIELENLIKNEKIQAIKKHVEEIKNEFNDKFNALR